VKLPNAFIIGAAKSGTTSLHRYLGQHPDVFAVEPKEPRFFAYDGYGPRHRGPGQANWASSHIVTDLRKYRALFAGGDDRAIRLESSVIYLDLPIVADRILARVPDARFLVVLRDPAERAWSQWVVNRREGHEPLGFAEALAAEDERYEAGWNWLFWYRARGRYASLLAEWLARVPADRVLVHLHEDLDDDPQAVVAAGFEHLGVDAFTADVSTRHNGSGTPRRLRRDARPKLPAADRAALARDYGAEIDALEPLIGRDLSAWR
jgi:hypothetical protein